METWILIMVLLASPASDSGASIYSQEFNSKKTCEDASKIYMSKSKEMTTQNFSFCVMK